ncbi:MAG: hypothetical protein IJS61_10155 [Firmicutes bacterium]|nr:hypothetical protein [Bacillota bacterium]
MKKTILKNLSTVIAATAFVLGISSLPVRADILDHIYVEENANVRRINISVDEGELVNINDRLYYSLNSYDWRIDNSDIADISHGVIDARNSGHTQIAAISQYEVVVFNITVNTVRPVRTIRNITKDITIFAGDKKDLSTYVSDAATDYAWETDSKSTVSVTNRGDITGRSKGYATVKAYSYYDDGDYTFNITVRGEETTKKTSTKTKTETFDLYLNRSDSIDVSQFMEKDPDKYDWTVYNRDVCKVYDGVITAKGTGTTTVEAEGSKNYTFNVHVNRNYNVIELNIREGRTVDIENYLDNGVKNYHITCLDRSVAKVNGYNIKAEGEGTTYITCQSKDVNEVTQFIINVY